MIGLNWYPALQFSHLFVSKLKYWSVFGHTMHYFPLKNGFVNGQIGVPVLLALSYYSIILVAFFV